MNAEQVLLDDIRRGDRAAMRRLYDRYSGYATAVGLRYIPDREDLRDVLQDCFVKIFTSIGRFEYRGEGSVRGWIARIVANEALDFLRHNQRFSYTDNIPDNTDDEDPNVQLIPPNVLTEMIGRLPVGYRAVLNMYVFEQMSHKEIAERLGIRENSSASQFSRAKRMMRTMINEYLKNNEI